MSFDIDTSTKTTMKKMFGKSVIMLPEKIVFASVSEAAEYLQKVGLTKCKDIKGIASHIRKVCNKKRKNAYSHQWQWHNS